MSLCLGTRVVFAMLAILCWTWRTSWRACGLYVPGSPLLGLAVSATYPQPQKNVLVSRVDYVLRSFRACGLCREWLLIVRVFTSWLSAALRIRPPPTRRQLVSYHVVHIMPYHRPWYTIRICAMLPGIWYVHSCSRKYIHINRTANDRFGTQVFFLFSFLRFCFVLFLFLMFFTCYIYFAFLYRHFYSPDQLFLHIIGMST